MTIRSVDWSGKLEPMGIQLRVRLSFAFPGVKMNAYTLAPIYINTGREAERKNDALNSIVIIIITTTSTTTTTTTTSTRVRLKSDGTR
jgi:hypothetical protein